jgi:hypothetical protein
MRAFFSELAKTLNPPAARDDRNNSAPDNSSDKPIIKVVELKKQGKNPDRHEPTIKVNGTEPEFKPCPLPEKIKSLEKKALNESEVLTPASTLTAAARPNGALNRSLAEQVIQQGARQESKQNELEEFLQEWQKADNYNPKGIKKLLDKIRSDSRFPYIFVRQNKGAHRVFTISPHSTGSELAASLHPGLDLISVCAALCPSSESYDDQSFIFDIRDAITKTSDPEILSYGLEIFYDADRDKKLQNHVQNSEKNRLLARHSTHPFSNDPPALQVVRTLPELAQLMGEYLIIADQANESSIVETEKRFVEYSLLMKHLS